MPENDFIRAVESIGEPHSSFITNIASKSYPGVSINTSLMFLEEYFLENICDLLPDVEYLDEGEYIKLIDNVSKNSCRYKCRNCMTEKYKLMIRNMKDQMDVNAYFRRTGRKDIDYILTEKKSVGLIQNSITFRLQ